MTHEHEDQVGYVRLVPPSVPEQGDQRRVPGVPGAGPEQGEGGGEEGQSFAYVVPDEDDDGDGAELTLGDIALAVAVVAILILVVVYAIPAATDALLSR